MVRPKDDERLRYSGGGTSSVHNPGQWEIVVGTDVRLTRRRGTQLDQCLDVAPAILLAAAGHLVGDAVLITTGWARPTRPDDPGDLRLLNHGWRSHMDQSTAACLARGLRRLRNTHCCRCQQLDPYEQWPNVTHYRFGRALVAGRRVAAGEREGVGGRVSERVHRLGGGCGRRRASNARLVPNHRRGFALVEARGARGQVIGVPLSSSQAASNLS